MRHGTDVLYERRGQAAWLRLNRPAVMNSLSPGTVRGLSDALARAAGDADVRAVVITGSGPAFCAGADLTSFDEPSGDGPAGPGEGGSPDGLGPLPGRIVAFLHSAAGLFSALDRFPKPVIAAVNGLALAGGLEIVLCCDLVVAAESARLGDAHANYGLLPGGGASIRLPRKVGVNHAKYLLYTGERLPAAAFQAMGLVNRVVPDDELEAATDELVASIATKSPLGLKRMKELVHDGLGQPLDVGLRLELLASEAHAHSEDLREGLAAFREKRTPAFRGR